MIFKNNLNSGFFVKKFLVGKIGGRQLVSLAAGCLYDYIIWHEIMHALGLEHEHQRPDRDKFIKIQKHNVDPDKLGIFYVYKKIDHLLSIASSLKKQYSFKL